MAKSNAQPFGENIKYYCKDCEKFIEGRQVGRKYVFRCPICNTKNVAFGTEKSLINFFHLDEKRRKEEKKKENAKEPEDAKK